MPAVKLFRDEIKRRKPREIPRCRCGCGREALWPKDGKPLFWARLCGYKLAVKMFRQKQS